MVGRRVLASDEQVVVGRPSTESRPAGPCLSQPRSFVAIHQEPSADKDPAPTWEPGEVLTNG
jgi:hypothetical protein